MMCVRVRACVCRMHIECFRIDDDYLHGGQGCLIPSYISITTLSDSKLQKIVSNVIIK